MAAADVDVGYLAGHLGLDEPVLTTLTTQPDVDLVKTLLLAVATKAHEFDDLYASKLQTDIELESAVHSSETRSQTFKATADKALKDVEEARLKLHEEENKRQAVENELQIIKTKAAEHDSEVKALTDKIETLQASNRTNLSIIESNTKRDQTVSEELTKQHQRNVELSRELTALQQSEQNAKGQLNSAKYREESLQQQLDLARRNGEWLETELKTKSEEALKYRKEKGARIAELQRQNDDARSQVEAFARTEQQLRERIETLQSKTDDALVQLQKQEASSASTIESYKHELEDQRRLVEMSEQLSRQHQERVKELDAEKERLRDNYENELRRVRLELEQEKQAEAQLEEKIRQLESEVDELQVRAEQTPPPGSAPQTPRPNGSGMRAASPFGTPASIRSKSALTATQAIDQLYQVKGELAIEKRKTQRLSEEIDGLMATVEAKAPEIQELQSESDLLRQEMARMSELLQQSFDERDHVRRAARKAEAALSTSQSEGKILRTQLRDLGTQIQMLVFNSYAMEKGIDQLTDDEKIRLQQLEKGEISEEALSDMSETHQFITRKLVVFKDIKSLQGKNEDLLRITRELAEQLESDEALAAKHQAKEDHDMVDKLQQELLHMTEEAKSIKNTMESYKMERDMFRRLLQQRGVNEDTTMMHNSSFDDSQRAPLASIESGEQAETIGEALRKLQAEYDSFRDAQDGVRKDFRAQIDHLTAEKSTLQTEKIRLHGEAKLESERREMLHSNFVALQNENGELQKRNQSLSETAAKQDIRTQQVVEELIEAKGLIDGMRSENANLKAEKKLWKDIQDRMSKDNENLIEEKNRLNNLLATQQSLENERNMSDSEARRKAFARIETLERELSEVQRKLSSEAEETKKLQMRKEYEGRESQKRIDELMTSLGQLREDQVGLKTSRDHLQARVDELTVDLRNAEERATRLQPRPTPRVGTSGETTQYQEQLESEIQELNGEVSDLKRELDLARTHLENAKAQAEQYKELSQGNEETLEDLRSSQEQYKTEMESLIEEKEKKVQELKQRVEDVSSELNRSNTELSTIRDSQAEVARRFEDEKAILEEEVKRLKEDSSRHLETARFHQQDLRAQADIASKAQQDYEQELVRHADAAKLAQQLRVDYNALKSESATLRAEADSAKVALAQGEASWEDRRNRLEQEMTELKVRREDANAQNKLLHQQLESLTGQLATLQQNRQGGGPEDEDMTMVSFGDASEGLRELNTYLRREKEILEVQYDVKGQEAKRLQQQLEYTQSQLDEARLKLDQERTQAAQGGRASMTHQDLMEKLNELNLYRESSMTLRNENGQLKDQITQKNKKIEEMEAKVQPLESEIDQLKTQKDFLELEMKQVQEDRDRWQKRTEGILTKYGRVDPAEMEQLRETIANLETERNALKEGEQPLKDKVTELESTLETERANWSSTRSRLADQFKERSRKLVGEKNEAVQKANALQEQLNAANAEVGTGQKNAEESTQQVAELEAQLETSRKEVEKLREAAAAAQSTAADATMAQTEDDGSSGVVAQLEQQLAALRQELETVAASKAEAEQQLETLRSEMQTAISERDSTIEKLQQASTEQRGAEVPQRAEGEQTTTTTTTTEPAADAAQDGGAQGLSTEEKKALEEKITAAETKAAEADAKANELEAKITQTIAERSNNMKDKLNAKLKETRNQMEQEFKKKEEDLQLKFEQDKKIWLAENPPAQPAAATATTSQAPSTPVKGDAEAAPATPAVPATPDLSQLDDAGIRQFLSTNTTVKSIMAANIKKRLEIETAKLKSEYEPKIASAREQAQMLESKKSTLRINMAEKKFKTASAKLGVVETAASETPQKPVVEVWEVAKKTEAPVAAAASTASPAAKPPLARQPSATTTQPAASAPTPAKAQPQTGTPTTNGSEETPKENNPFAVTADASKPDAPNPFAANAEAGSPAPTAQPNKGQTQPPAARSGIPQPRGGGRGRGTYTTPGQRAASGNQDGTAAPASARGGRGGARGGRGGGLNPAAQDFQAGNKRPRGDSEVGTGAKRARGAH